MTRDIAGRCHASFLFARDESRASGRAGQRRAAPSCGSWEPLAVRCLIRTRRHRKAPEDCYRSCRVAQPVTASRGDGSPGTDGTGRGSAWSAAAGFDSPGTVGEGAGEGPVVGSVAASAGADGTGDASEGVAGSGTAGAGTASVGADGTRASSAGAVGAADGCSETAALACVQAVASSTTARALPAAATPRATVLRTVRGRRVGSVIERTDGFTGFRLRVTGRSVCAGADTMTAPGRDVVHTSRVSW